jgi:hypothetical protein
MGLSLGLGFVPALTEGDSIGTDGGLGMGDGLLAAGVGVRYLLEGILFVFFVGYLHPFVRVYLLWGIMLVGILHGEG